MIVWGNFFCSQTLGEICLLWEFFWEVFLSEMQLKKYSPKLIMGWGGIFNVIKTNKTGGGGDVVALRKCVYPR